jgi:hypothetical protein
MKGKGPKHERKTIIVFDEEDLTASIWTASETVYRRLRKAGYVPSEDSERSASFELPRVDIKLPRPKQKRIITDEQRRQARNRMETVRNSVSCSRDQLN